MNPDKPILLKRGRHEIALKKIPDRFAIRLKKGIAKDMASLRPLNIEKKEEPEHIDSDPSERMEIFSVREHVMEETVDHLRKAPRSEIVTHMYTTDDTPDGAFIPTGRMTIRFTHHTEKETREQILAENGLEIEREIDYLPDGYIVRLTSASKENPLKIAQKLQSQKNVLIAEPDLSFKVAYKFIPKDTLYPQQWHLNNLGEGTGLVAGADVKAEKAWDYTLGSRNIVICVMDDGFDFTHPDLNAPGKIIAPYDFGQDDTDPSPVDKNDNHGTACAGVALAEQNGTGAVGLAPGCAFMPVRTSGWLSDNAIEELFQYAIDKHADVISCSWAAAAPYFPLSTIMQGIIHKAATRGRRNRKGCVILFAAGNESAPLQGKMGDINYHQGFALHPDVIAVAASNSLDRQSYYSNYGPEIAICAPSSGSPGRGILTTDRTGTPGYEKGDYTFGFGGTSSATPLCAGLAGLILSIDPELTASELRNIIMQTADKIDRENGEYNADGHSPKYGHGRINAHRALKMVSGNHDGNNGEGRLPQTLFMEHRVKQQIPDKGEIKDTIPFPLMTNIRAVEISVEIKHTWRGDLSVYLKPPGHDEILLHHNSGHNANDLVMICRSSDDPELFAGLAGQPAQGDWILRVTDNAERDTGVLNKWGITIHY